MKHVVFLSILCSFLGGALVGQSPQLVVNNRVLAKVNNKAITVVDVTKKMDMILLRQYPEEFASTEVRHQFYQANWQHVLSDLIDRELVVLAAEELQWPVQAGDIRQEMEEIFGPNVRMNLENAGLTFDEVWQMLRADIIIRRMLSLNVNTRVLAEITPQRVRMAYEEYLKDSKFHEEYSYRIVTFKAKEAFKAMEVAQVAHKLLKQDLTIVEKLKEELKTKYGVKDEAVSITLSSPFTQRQDVLAEPIREVLASLTPGSVSQPLEQRSRSDGSLIVRLYVLESKKSTEPLAFSELEAKLKDGLLKQRLAEETGSYFTKLRKHFDVRLEDIQKDLPQSFAPYALRRESFTSPGIFEQVAGIDSMSGQEGKGL